MALATQGGGGVLAVPPAARSATMQWAADSFAPAGGADPSQVLPMSAMSRQQIDASGRTEQPVSMIPLGGPSGAPSPADLPSSPAPVGRDFAGGARQVTQEPQRQAASGYGLGSLAREARASNKAAGESLAGARDALDGATDARRQTLNDQIELAQNKAAEQAAYQRQQNAETMKLDAESADTQARYRDEMAGQRGKIQTLTASLKDKSVDPNRIFKNADGSTDWGTSALAAISIALGELGRAFTGGPNAALSIINDKIGRDMAAQQSDIDSAKGEIDAEGNVLAMMRQEFGDDMQARQASKIAMLERYKQQLGELDSEYAGPEQKARMQELMAGLDAQQAQEQAAFDEKAHALTMNRLAFEQSNMVVGAQLSAERAKAQAAGGAKPISGKEAAVLGEIKSAEAALDDFEKADRDAVFGTDSDQRTAVAARLASALGMSTDEAEGMLPGRVTPQGKATDDIGVLRALLKQRRQNRAAAAVYAGQDAGSLGIAQASSEEERD